MSTSMARPLPTIRESVWVPPAAGSIASDASGMLNTASSEASRMSHSAAISRPEPITWPCSAATTGFSMEANSPQRSRAHRTSRATAWEGAVPNSVRSAPAQKPRPPTPRRMAARTPGSSRTASIAWKSSSLIRTLKALMTSGRLSAISATESRLERSTVLSQPGGDGKAGESYSLR